MSLRNRIDRLERDGGDGGGRSHWDMLDDPAMSGRPADPDQVEAFLAAYRDGDKDTEAAMRRQLGMAPADDPPAPPGADDTRDA